MPRGRRRACPRTDRSVEDVSTLNRPKVPSRSSKQPVTVSLQRTAILCVELRHADIVRKASDIDNWRPVMPLTEQQKQARAEKRRMTNALKEEARAHRDEARRIEWREKGMYLTREQAAAGEPCRGCGLPVIDNLGDWGGTMYLTPEQRSEYDADQAKYREMHPTCDAYRWSMQGSRATHCGYCCPPLPMSREQSEPIGRLLASLPERREKELDIWERTLTCGHKVEQSVHHTRIRPRASPRLGAPSAR